MNNKIKHFVAAVAFIAAASASTLTAFAQKENLPDNVYDENNGIAFRKSAELQDDGSYIIDLEAYVTGDVHITQESIPADIVLVLDVSGSMNDQIATYNYTARASQGYSYNSYGNNNTYYYRHTDGNYYPVERQQVFRFTVLVYTWYYYRLRYEVDGTYYYLSGNSVTTSAPTDVEGAGDTIWTGVLYTRQTVSSQSKIDALKNAVNTFIDEIKKNDLIDPNTDQPRETPLGNQISIVKFASNAYYNSNAGYNSDQAPTTVGNHLQNNGYNYTEVIAGFTSTATDANVTSLKNTVNGLTPGGATAADYGMNLARLLLKSLPTSGENDRSGTTKTVVFFTDGAPTYSSSFENNVATNAIANANPIKNTYKAMVFSIGVFDNETDNIRSFMNRVSSNNPTAQSMTQPANYAQGDYYQNASDADLEAIFKSVAQQSGGIGNTDVDAESSVTVDVVSTSFSIPVDDDDFEVEVLVAPTVGEWTVTAADAQANPEYAEYVGKTYLLFGTAKEATEYDLPAITPDVDENNNKISTSGFDFSANWCGEDDTAASGYHGYKQIIRFKITPNEDAVGGPHVFTNERGSGIYVNDIRVAEFNRPTIKLPVSIWIQKEGLVGDDSAVFTIYRAPYEGAGVTPSEDKYEQFTKIIANKNTMDSNNMVKLVGLDPNYYYKIKEDAWAWSYEYSDYGAKYTVGEGVQNPFLFENTPKDDIVKHAEATVHNEFVKRVVETPQD